jgi:hypothetical protein
MAPRIKHIVEQADSVADLAVAEALAYTPHESTAAIDHAIHADDAVAFILAAAATGAPERDLLAFLDAARVAAARSRLALT